MNISKTIATEFNIRESSVEKTIQLIDEGNTIPFIARYRKEVTGGMSDVTLRELDERLNYLRGLEDRKEEVLRLIEEQGKLTEDLKREIESAQVLQRVEDLYKPYKKKRATRASKARERGLEPLAMRIMLQQETKGDPADFAADFVDADKDVATVQDALQGACDIIAEELSEDADRIEEIRTLTWDKGILETEAADPEESTVYDMYYGKTEAIRKIPNHRILAINRGEKEKKLKVKAGADPEIILDRIREQLIRNPNSIYAHLLEDTAADAYKRLIAPSVERETRNELTRRAEEEAVRVFAKNTENLLMVPPVRGKKVISIDPGYRTGCKVAALDETGRLMAWGTVYPTKPREDVAGTERTLRKIIDKYGCDIIVIGNGTASRETEEVVAGFLRKTGLPIQYTIVNEAGASVYSASKLAAEEYPDLDVTTRGAMSLGRRLQDPLAELVKIDPKHIGVGQYQHDINQKMLDNALTGVVENCVNRVGVDLNTASPSLLSYIAGINGTIAKNIVAYREEHGRFNSRRELLKVAKLGPKAFEQCAGFLRISGGKEPLDSTSVHPESYAAAKELMKKLGISGESIERGGTAGIDDLIAKAYPAKRLSDSITAMASDMGIGKPTLTDIIAELKKPARDPREEAPPVIFRNDVKSFDDLKEGMELEGTVRNVVDFGAFVDIGVKQDGLVHVSQMSRKYVNHPMDVVAVGDTVKVKILSVDKQKQKISLTMIV